MITSRPVCLLPPLRGSRCTFYVPLVTNLTVCILGNVLSEMLHVIPLPVWPGDAFTLFAGFGPDRPPNSLEHPFGPPKIRL